MDVERSTLATGYPPSIASSRRRGPPSGAKSKPSSTARTMSRNVKRLQEAVNLHLNHYEKELFLDALNEYHSQKDSWGFVELLRTILNTPAKQLLVPMIRLVLPAADIPEFDKCVQLSAAVARGEQGADYNSSTDSRELNILQIFPASDGIGFTIKSGHHGKPGKFVSSVDPRSEAYVQGLAVGDEILEANDIDLSKTSNEDAALILRAARTLTLTVRHSNTQTNQETYTWVDTDGRSCSPPPSESELNNTLRSSISKKSGMTLLSSQDERRINLRIEKGHGLGLSIRGGSEYGLGIYITGVDEGSSAKRSGIRVGDQVLAVNDVQLVDITHKDAVKALKRSRHMILTIKHVGKLPHAKIDDRKLVSRRDYSSSTEDVRRQSRMRYPGSLDRRKYHDEEYQQHGFTKGAGSQLMLSRNMALPQQSHNSRSYAVVEEQARNLLNDNERGTLKFYLDEYNKSYVSVEALVAALKELFNTQAKFQMFHELRHLIHPRDVEKYDKLVVKVEVSFLKSRHERSQDQMSDFSLDSILSAHSTNSTNESLTLHLSANQNLQNSEVKEHIAVPNGTESVRSNKMLVTDGSKQRVVTYTPSAQSQTSAKPARSRSFVTAADVNYYSSPEDSPRDISKSVPRMGVRAAKISPKPDGLSPGEDSGVDVRVKAGSTSQSGSSYTDTMSRPMISSPPAQSKDLPDTTDSDESSIEAVKQQYRHSYSMSGSANLDSEDEHIPGLHSDLDISDQGNVVLVNSKDVGTLPRRPATRKESNTPATPTFREQVKNRSRLSGKMYLPPSPVSTSQRQEIPLSDTDYDTLDILNISKELYATALSDEREAEKLDTESWASLPPPPPQLLSSNTSTLESKGYAQSSNHGAEVSHYASIGQLQEEEKVKVKGQYDETAVADPELDDQAACPHPAVLQGRSPQAEKKSPRVKSDTNIYAVVKRHSPRPLRPSMSFEPPNSDSDSSPSSPTAPDIPTKLDDTTTQSADVTSQEEVVRVNKLRSTLGLAIEGGAGTKQPIPRIISIQETGCAHNSELKIGHLILRVNDRYMEGLSHNQAARAIADAFRDRKTAYLDFLVKLSTEKPT
ncbi:DFNB31 [Bugula neritina]|uniref:DFNB31 n=1 Tax=Bugula neritina TaxID=10212 RepID=A0A7J7K9G9_BUGNE|nr:DFNB31 [Bugula neritina]